MTPWLAIIMALLALYAAWNVYAAVRVYLTMPRLPTEVEPLTSWPKVSLIVPACNEGAAMEAATMAKLASDYPNLEVILVDDRSTDATTEIVNRLAASDPRVRGLRIDALPAGWLGKVHALHRGAQIATGDWLLFSDADVHMAPSLLRRVIATVERRELDFVGMMPHIWPRSFVLDAAIASLYRIIIIASRLWKVSDPRSRVAAGNGVFNLARRTAFEKTQGFEWLKLEILDDQVLAQMMKRSGARCSALDPKDDLALHFYPSLGEMMRGLEKNGYVFFGQLRPVQMIMTMALVLFFEVGPALALVRAETRLAGALIFGVLVAVQVGLARAGRRRLLSAFVPLLGVLLLMVFCVRAAVLAHVRGGIVWRGVLYPLEALRKGARLELF